MPTLNSYHMFANHVQRENRYFYDSNVQDFLEFIASSFSERTLILPNNTRLWRSKLGHDILELENNINGFPEYEEIPVPWGPDRMIPDASKVLEGRANPRGIAYLYLATNKETAMHEVRPWVGSTLSTAVFRVIKDQKLVDFSKFHGRAKQCSLFLLKLPIGDGSALPWNEEQIREDVWIDIDNAFSTPVPNKEDPTNYIPTQVIAEFVKRNGYDGIAYKSVFSDESNSDGFNIVLFDLKAASLFNCSLYDVTEVKMSFTKQENPRGEYYIKQEST